VKRSRGLPDELRFARDMLVRSEDGGRTWHTRSLRVGGREGPAVRVAFADAADGVMTGLHTSVDAGRICPPVSGRERVVPCR
jgi:hypothetical protein